MDALKLLALDPEDLGVLAAHAQDAVGVVGDWAFEPKARRCVGLINRLERRDEPGGRGGVRKRAALRIERVRRAEVQGLDLGAKSAPLVLLTLVFEPTEAPAGTITLIFAGEAAIRLHVECIEASLTDLGPAWSTPRKPDHTQ